MCAYLVLLRVEIARFTRTKPARLCCSNPHLIPCGFQWRGVTSYAVLCSPDVPPVRPFGPTLARRLYSYAPAAVWQASQLDYRRNLKYSPDPKNRSTKVTMIRITELKLPLDHAPDALPQLIASTIGIAANAIASHTIYKRSYDARKQKLLLVYICDVQLTDASQEAALLKAFANHPHIRPTPDQAYYPVAKLAVAPAIRPVVVGFGPCGIFAALLLAQMGFKPIVLERGKKVRERTKDTWGLWRKGLLNPESNVQFGEGGAGTFSDGKLWSQIKDPRHLGRKVMLEFVKAGAPEEILLVSKPHIGTFKLVKVVEHMREQIIALGGGGAL